MMPSRAKENHSMDKHHFIEHILLIIIQRKGILSNQEKNRNLRMINSHSILSMIQLAHANTRRRGPGADVKA
jgi:hypothetical protein